MKISVIGFCFPGVYTHAYLLSNLGYAVSSVPACANSKSPGSGEEHKWLQSINRKSLWGPKGLSPKILTVFLLQDPRETLLRSCRTNHRSITPAGASGLSTREVERRSGNLADRTLRIAFRRRRRQEMCLSTSQHFTALYMAPRLHLQAAAIAT